MSDDDEADARLDSDFAENDISEGTPEDEASGLLRTKWMIQTLTK